MLVCEHKLSQRADCQLTVTEQPVYWPLPSRSECFEFVWMSASGLNIFSVRIVFWLHYSQSNTMSQDSQ